MTNDEYKKTIEDRMILLQDNVQMRINRASIEQHEHWMENGKIIPFISFPSEWKIKIVPPYLFACIRFIVLLPSGKEKSIYLDTENALGVFCIHRLCDKPIPYWEVHPYEDDMPGRCHIDDIKTLLEMIAYE